MSDPYYALKKQLYDYISSKLTPSERDIFDERIDQFKGDIFAYITNLILKDIHGVPIWDKEELIKTIRSLIEIDQMFRETVAEMAGGQQSSNQQQQQEYNPLDMTAGLKILGIDPNNQSTVPVEEDPVSELNRQIKEMMNLMIKQMMMGFTEQIKQQMMNMMGGMMSGSASPPPPQPVSQQPASPQPPATKGKLDSSLKKLLSVNKNNNENNSSNDEKQ